MDGYVLCPFLWWVDQYYIDCFNHWTTNKSLCKINNWHTWKSCHYYSIQVYDNSNMVFRKQLRSMTAPRTVHFILQSWGKLYTIEISTDFQDQVPYTYSKYTCLNEKTNKKGSKIRNPINNVSRYLKDISKIALHLESKKTQKFYK